jgi:hypothetical protein
MRASSEATANRISFLLNGRRRNVAASHRTASLFLDASHITLLHRIRCHPVI